MGHAWPWEETGKHSLHVPASSRRGCCRPLGVPADISSANISIRLEYLCCSPAAEDTESQEPETVFLLITPSAS